MRNPSGPIGDIEPGPLKTNVSRRGLTVTAVAVVLAGVLIVLTAVSRVNFAITEPYESGRVSFAYPSAWSPDSSAAACGSVREVVCVAAVRDRTAIVIIYIVRSPAFVGQSTDDFASDFWDGFVQRYSGIVVPTNVSEEPVDGYEARLYFGSLHKSDASLTSPDQYIRVAVIRTGADEYLIAQADAVFTSVTAATDLIRSIKVKPREDEAGSA